MTRVPLIQIVALGLLHTIGGNGRRNGHDPFIQRYVFPGSGTPKLSEVSRQLEDHGLAILDVENMVRHYACTVERWWERFRANYHTLDHGKYDAVFKRTWEYYLCYCEAGFLAGRVDVGMYTLERPRGGSASTTT